MINYSSEIDPKDIFRNVLPGYVFFIVIASYIFFFTPEKFSEESLKGGESIKLLFVGFPLGYLFQIVNRFFHGMFSRPKMEEHEAKVLKRIDEENQQDCFEKFDLKHVDRDNDIKKSKTKNKHREISMLIAIALI